MFTPTLRFLLAAAVAVFAVSQLARGERSAYLLLLAAALLVAGHFRYGAIRPAFFAMRRGEVESARRLIRSVKRPNLLSPQSRAYWHWIQAVIAADLDKDLGRAESQMRLAVEGALRTSHDRCIATATLARIVGYRGDLDRARGLLAEAKKIPHREGAEEYLGKLAEELATLA